MISIEIMFWCYLVINNIKLLCNIELIHELNIHIYLSF